MTKIYNIKLIENYDDQEKIVKVEAESDTEALEKAKCQYGSAELYITKIRKI